MKISKQLLKEFWAPLIVGVVWAVYANSNARTNIEGPASGLSILAPLISQFAPSFFFTSWLLSQFFRVSKQIRTEDSLKLLETRLTGLVDRISTETDRMIGSVIGGDSFVHLTFVDRHPGSTKMTLAALHEGSYPVYDVQVRMVDLERFNILQPTSLASFSAQDRNLSIGNLSPGYSKVLDSSFQLSDEKKHAFNIFFIGRNGGWYQNIFLQFIDGEWRQASRVIRQQSDGSSEEIYRKIDEGFSVAASIWP